MAISQIKQIYCYVINKWSGRGLPVWWQTSPIRMQNFVIQQLIQILAHEIGHSLAWHIHLFVANLPVRLCHFFSALGQVKTSWCFFILPTAMAKLAGP